jgi:hypothetical protein
MRFVGVLKAPRLDPGHYKRISEELERFLTRAATAWLNAVTGIVPVWSGAAQSTFKKLADSVNYHMLIAPRARPRISLGRASGDGGLEIDEKEGRYFFTYSTTLRHLIFNEFNSNPQADPAVFSDLIEPIPYKFQLAGQKAFESVAQFVRLPQPKFIVGVTFRVG